MIPLSVLSGSVVKSEVSENSRGIRPRDPLEQMDGSIVIALSAFGSQ